VNDLTRGVVVAAALLGGAFVVSSLYGKDRWQLAPAPGGAVYRLDGLTGDVAFCTPLFCRPLPTLVPKQDKSMSAPQQGAPVTPGGSPPAAKVPSTGT
jgi:hypothetical protein